MTFRPTIPRGRPASMARHGLTDAEVQGRIRYQGGRCSICRGPLGFSFAADHDHEMAKRHPHPVEVGCRYCFRSLLCSSCNSVLGFAHDQPEVLDNAAAYIRAWRKQHPVKE